MTQFTARSGVIIPVFYCLRRPILVILGLLFFLLPLSVPAQAVQLPRQETVGPQDPAETEAFIDGVMHSLMKRENVPGAVVAVVKDGSLFFLKGYGYADLENHIPVDPELTLFRPGSVSKLFTWAAVMQLVEQGRISLDEDVNAYIDFTIPDTFPEPITMKHLMTHTPGFEDVGRDLFTIDPQGMLTLESYLKTRLPERVFPPGEIGAYSNYGTALAGYIVQRVSGIPFELYIEQNILSPLGMESSTFYQPLPESLAANMSGGYNYLGGVFLRGDFEYISASPAGGLSATGADMARFMLAHLQDGQFDGERILEEETAVQMRERLFTPDRHFEGIAYGFFREIKNGMLVLSHGGDTFLFHSNLVLIPGENAGFFISTNGTTGAAVVEGFTGAFIDRYFPVEAPGEMAPPSGFQERIKPFLGEYYLSRSNFTTFEKLISLLYPVSVRLDREGNLLVNLMGQSRLFVEVEPGLLQDSLEPNRQLVYRAGADGRYYLIPPAPVAFIKSPWYGTTAFQGSLLVFSIAMFLLVLIRWPVAAIANRKKGERYRAGARTARWAGFLASLVSLIFVSGLIMIFSNIAPAYGVPEVFFQSSSWLDIFLSLPIIVAVLSALMLFFTIIAWVRRYWSVGGRIFYSLLTLAAIVFVWQMTYWNLL